MALTVLLSSVIGIAGNAKFETPYFLVSGPGIQEPIQISPRDYFDESLGSPWSYQASRLDAHGISYQLEP